MKTLFIDTHLWDIRIALLENGKIVKKEEINDKKNNSELLFNALIKVIDNESYDEIIVVNGPGSFTGVRLGVIIAKTLAYTQNKPIKTITSLECMAISSGCNKVAFSDNNGYYVGLFNKDFTNCEYLYVSNDEINKYSDVVTDVIYDLSKIYEYCKNKECLNSHLVNPIYIKKIGVEK